jgi:hypothetical protein
VIIYEIDDAPERQNRVENPEEEQEETFLKGVSEPVGGALGVLSKWNESSLRFE